MGIEMARMFYTPLIITLMTNTYASTNCVLSHANDMTFSELLETQNFKIIHGGPSDDTKLSET